MKWHRIWAVVLRHLIQLPQDVNQWTSLLFWPILDIALFGFVGVWFHDRATQAELLALLSGVTLWQFITRINFDISLSLLEEAWSDNVINLFATPLHIMEWMCGVLLKGVVLGVCTLLSCVVFVWFTFGYNMFSIGMYLAYTILQLFMSGIALGVLGAALLLRWGSRAQTLMFILGFIACPISGAFYPVYILPTWLQSIAYSLPFAYIFEGLYMYIHEAVWDPSYILYASVLNGAYIAVTSMFFIRCYNTAKEHGIERITD